MRTPATSCCGSAPWRATPKQIPRKAAAVYADLWVLVDGQSRFRRGRSTACNGAFPVSVPFDENDRFLTLAATDGGNGIVADWILFGDPRLELLPLKQRMSQ